MVERFGRAAMAALTGLAIACSAASARDSARSPREKDDTAAREEWYRSQERQQEEQDRRRAEEEIKAYEKAMEQQRNLEKARERARAPLLKDGSDTGANAKPQRGTKCPDAAAARERRC